MKKATVRLVLVAAAVYYALLFLASSLSKTNLPPLLFLVGPLFVLVLILLRNLSYRAQVPTEVVVGNPPSRTLAREVQGLTRQIEVGSRASSQYFDGVVLARLREALVDKVAVETGLEPQRVREILGNHRLGPGLLKDETLYRLLYSPVMAVKGSGRVGLLEEAVARIEDWKP